jgi:hypothetical protein
MKLLGWLTRGVLALLFLIFVVPAACWFIRAGMKIDSKTETVTLSNGDRLLNRTYEQHARDRVRHYEYVLVEKASGKERPIAKFAEGDHTDPDSRLLSRIPPSQIWIQDFASGKLLGVGAVSYILCNNLEHGLAQHEPGLTSENPQEFREKLLKRAEQTCE